MNAIIKAIPSFLETLLRNRIHRSNYESIYALLNSADDQKDELILTWRNQKLVELSYVGITVCPYLPAS